MKHFLHVKLLVLRQIKCSFIKKKQVKGEIFLLEKVSDSEIKLNVI